MKSKGERILYIIFHVFISLSFYATSCEILKQVFYSVYSGFYFISGIIWSIFSYIVVMASHVLLCWGIVGKLPKKINEIDYLYVSIFTGVAIFICSFFWFTDIYDLMLQFMAICIGMSMCYYDKKNEPIEEKSTDDAEIVVEDATAVEEDETITDDVVVEEELDNGDLEVEEEIVEEIGVELLEEPDVAVCDIEEEQEIEQMSEEVVTKKSKFNMKKFLLWTIPSLIIIGVSVWLTIIACAEAPEYVVSYKDKFLWYYDMPNNSLCNDYLEKAKQANLKGLKKLEEDFYVKAELAKPDDIECIKSIAFYYLDKEVYDKSIELLENLNKKQHKDSSVFEMLAKAYYEKYFDYEKYEIAEEYKGKFQLYAEKALMLDSKNVDVIRLIVQFYVNYSQCDEGDCFVTITWADKFIEHCPDSAWGYIAKSLAYYKMDEKNDAIEMYHQACNVEPNHKYVEEYKFLGGNSINKRLTRYIYDLLISKGGRGSDYETFASKMGDESYRKKIANILTEGGADVDFDYFNQTLLDEYNSLDIN